jgi:hypothetical protein
MAKEQKPKTEIVDRVVLVQDPILGSRYELQSVEVRVEEENESVESDEQ